MKFGWLRADSLLIVIAASFALLTLLFVQLGAAVAEGKLAAIDVTVRDFFAAHRFPGGTTAFSAVTLLGKEFLVVSGVLVGWWLSERSKTLVVLVAVCGLASAEFVDFLKEGFGVGRPPAEVMTSRSLSFPSGHVAGAASMATLLSFVAWRRNRAVRVVAPISVLVVILVAVSRVYLDKHWASDTVGGGLVGVALGLACCAVYEWVFQRGRSRSASTASLTAK